MKEKKIKRKKQTITVEISELHINDYATWKGETRELKIAVPKNFSIPVGELKIAKEDKQSIPVKPLQIAKETKKERD